MSLSLDTPVLQLAEHGIARLGAQMSRRLALALAHVAGKARPGIAMALQNDARPDRAITVFAGADIEATIKAREHFAPYPPSSPQIGLFKDGQLVFMLERHQIENKYAEEIAQELTQAFDQHCAPRQAAAN